jgi:hypothetical protein
MHIRSRRTAITVSTLTLAASAVALTSGTAASAQSSATIYVVQGLPSTTVDVLVDDKAVKTKVPGASLAGPFTVESGSRTVSFVSGGKELLTRSVTLKPGQNTDLVLHLPVDPDAKPVLTQFDNSLAAVPDDKAAVVVTHTAAVPPADVVVDGKVLFANIANGESLSVVVPTATYSVKIVPAGESGPAVLGPVDLAVKGGSLNRVFAVGDPASTTMRVVTQVIDVPAKGSSAAPSRVDTGSGGQVAGYRPWVVPFAR